ncbi:hypothetical protein N7462_007589 [Penicillium macrosclerotiorum]|uniref:uncharacterized protein n=1 Tax=Penicillium macrosclerotiorum TaxID=303699 RepID=UPI0025476739|nr:uncharacterized protein N7462_007589 [Penicillium macrosclerotiorum]KAJ5679345.1 hypothetical protein N7462_007589 [Penicillium macrosclerotiorum]
MMSLKTIFLMGAPLPSSLDWDHDQLLNAAMQPFQDRHSPELQRTSTDQGPISSSQRPAKWRVLQPRLLERPNVHHDFYYGTEHPSFLISNQLMTAENDSSQEEDSILSEFYDRSFQVHETQEISLSRLQEYSTQENRAALESIEVSTTCAPTEQDGHAIPSFRIPGSLSDLQDLPTASYLESITPQTITVNLIVGIIAVHPPRRVVTRQWKSEFDIIEMVVGDETRTGFGVNFWLPAAKPLAAKTHEADRLGRSLAMLRPQDIILLRTVGLGSFRDRVYGQSLRGGMTQVDLLHRQPVDVTDAGGLFEGILQRSSFPDTSIADLSLEKARRVREWILRFVSATTDAAGGHLSGMSQTQRGHRLPPDTQ